MKTTHRALALPWRAHTEQPATLPMTALLALRDDPSGDMYLLDGHIYEMRPSCPGLWRRENTDTPVPAAEFWWLAEDELFRFTRVEVHS